MNVLPAPPVQRLGTAVLLQGGAVLDVLALADRGIRLTTRVDGINPPARVLELLDVLRQAAADLRDGTAQRRQAAVAELADRTDSTAWIGSEEAAELLGLSVRQVQRLASSLEAVRGPGRVWLFDPLTVEAYAADRESRRTG